MKLKSLLLIIFFLLLTLAGNAYQEDKVLSLDAAGISEFEAECGAGYLKIKGKEGIDKIEVRATIVLEGIKRDDIDDFIGDKITLTLKKWGDKAVLTSKVASFKSFSLFKTKNVHINLDVTVPRDTAWISKTVPGL